MSVNLTELRRQSRIAAGLTAFASLIVLGSLALSYLQIIRARRDLRAIKQQTVEAQKELSAVEKKKQELQANVKSLTSLVDTLVDGNPQATTALDAAATSNVALAQAVPRIFLHQRDCADAARTAAQKLRAKGYVVLGPDVISYEPVRKIEIVYFGRDDPQTEADVETIKQALQATNPEWEKVWWVQQDVLHPHPSRTYAVYLSK